MIENLKPSEIDEILELNKGLSIKTWPKSSFEHDLNNDIALIRVLKKDGEIIGYYDVWFLFENADLAFIAVKKEYQHQGYGTKLMKDVINNCLDHSIEFINLEVRKDDEKAVGLYRKFGFEEVNVRKDYYGTNRDALCMTRGLVNVEKEDISD